MDKEHTQSATIAVIGSLNTDLIARVPHFPAPGETLGSAGFAIGLGGKGANQAVACARLLRHKPKDQGISAGSEVTGNESSNTGSGSSIKVSMYGAVATDAFGTPALTALEAENIDTAGVKKLPHPEHTSGLAMIMVNDKSGENNIVLHGGANMQVSIPMIARSLNLIPHISALEAATKAHPGQVTLPTVAVMQLEIPLEVVAWITQLAAADLQTKPMEVVFNPAPAPTGGMKALQQIDWRGVHHLIMNETEAQILLASLPQAQSAAAATATKDLSELDLPSLTSAFTSLGIAHVVVTLGAQGLYYRTTAGEGDAGFVKAHVVEKVVDTTAAGDTFVGAYAIQVAKWASSAVDQEFDLRKACEVANRAAARTVERAGAQASIPFGDEVGML